MSKTTTVTAQVTFPDTLKKQLRDKSTRDVVTRSFADALRKDVKSESLKEIRQLNAHIQDIDDDFQHISAELYRFDKEKFLDGDGKVILLQRDWNKHHSRFKNILEQSRRNALKASAMIKQYRSAVLSHFKLEEIPDIKNELKGFMEEVEAEQKQALASQNSFKKLAEDLRLFATVIESALERAGARLSIALENARTRLAQLEKKLKVVTKKMHSMGVACVSHLAVGAAAVAITIFTLSPAALGVAVGSVVGAVSSGHDYVRSRREANALQADIKQCEEEIAKLVAQEALFKKYQRSLAGAQKEIRTLAGKIDVIANIWQSLKADMQMLHEELKLVTKGKVITSRFSAKLQAARELYLDLSALLEAYGKSLSPVDPARAQKPDARGQRKEPAKVEKRDDKQGGQPRKRTPATAKKNDAKRVAGKPEKKDGKDEKKDDKQPDKRVDAKDDEKNARRDNKEGKQGPKKSDEAKHKVEQVGKKDSTSSKDGGRRKDETSNKAAAAQRKPDRAKG